MKVGEDLERESCRILEVVNGGMGEVIKPSRQN